MNIKEKIPHNISAFFSKIPLAWLIFILFVLIILFLLFSKPRVTEEKTQERTWQVHSIKAERDDYSPMVVLHGITESPQHATLEAAITADILATPVLEGNQVKQSELLIKLDGREARFNLEQRQGDVNELHAQLKTETTRYQHDKMLLIQQKRLVELNKKDLKRQKNLRKKRVSSQSTVDETEKKLVLQMISLSTRQQSIDNHKHRVAALQAKLEKSNALLDRAKLDVERTQLKSPFDGIVTQLLVSKGNRVQPGEALIRLYESNSIELRAQIPTQYVNRIREAIINKQVLTGVVTIDNTNIQLKLDRLASLIAKGRGGVDALFTIYNKKNLVTIGKAVEIFLELPKEKNVFKVPSEAIYGHSKLYLIKNNRMFGIHIQRKGIMYDKNKNKNYIIIQSDTIKDNDRIITTQLPNAREGLRVLW